MFKVRVRAVLAAIVLASCAIGFGAGSGTALGPVTREEVDITLTKVEQALSSLPGMESSIKPVKRPTKAGLASRAYIIQQLDRLFEKAKPNFKFTPRKEKFDEKMLVAADSGITKKALRKLIAWGCVAKVGPLATGPKDTIGLREFGDAMGFFVARISDLSHSPSSKFSPGMMGGIGG
jgi:hypothetical protein